jgi:arsenate reductase
MLAATRERESVGRASGGSLPSVSDADSGLTVYEKPTCSICRSLFALLTERGIDFERVNYIIDPLSASQIGELVAKAGLRPRDVVRMKEPGASQLPLEDDHAVLAALEAHPELLQRPIVVRGERAVLARPPERVLELLS